VPTSSPQAPPVLEISSKLVKSFTRKDPQEMYPPLFSLNNQVDVPSTWTDPQEMYPLLFSVTTTQVYVPSTCTTKDVPFNVLRQRIFRRLVLWIFVRGNKRYLRQLVLLILLEREKGDTKEFRQLVPLFFWKREKRDTKRIQTISPCWICRSKLHDESRLILGVLMITKMMTKSSKVKITSW